MTSALVTSGLFGRQFSEPGVAGEFSAEAFGARMLAFEAAWTRALAATGAVTPGDAAAALAAIARARPDPVALGAGSDRDGVPVPALVAALREGLGPGPAAAIHTGATSQDVVDTAMALTLLAVADRIGALIDGLALAVAQLRARFGDRPLMARTRMQAAMPVTVGLRLDAWARPLAGAAARLPALRAEVGRVQAGGAVGQRDRPPGPAEAVAAHAARELGLGLGPVWHSDRSGIAGFGHWLVLVAGAVGKIGQDIALMAQQGVDEIAFSGGGGSSAMPHKENPVAAEAMVALARYVAGQQGVLAQALIHEQERSGAAWALEWLTLPAMAEATAAALAQGQRILGSVIRIGTPD